MARKSRHSARICVYCSNKRRPAEEHPLPAQFGEFENDRYLYRICPPCNSAFGELESFLCFCTPVAYSKYRYGIKGRARYLTSPFRRGSHGYPAIKVFLQEGDIPVLVDPAPGRLNEAHPVDQVVIEDQRKREFHHFRLQPGIKKTEFVSWYRGLHIRSTISIYLRCNQRRYWHLKELIRSVFPGKWKDSGTQEPDVRRVRTRAKCVFSTAHYRAIAKIAFHHFLAWSDRNYTGFESMFDSIKAFIHDDQGKSEDFVVGRLGQVPVELNVPGLNAGLKHFIAVNEGLHQITSDVVLFQQESDTGIGHTVKLTGRSPIAMRVTERRRVWAYLYGKVPGTKYAGRVITTETMWNSK